MKKFVAAMAVLAMFAVVTFTSCAKSKVSKALDAYEKVVVQMEKTSLKDTASLKKLGKDAAAAADEIDDLEDSETWTKSEEKRYEKLTERFEKYKNPKNYAWGQMLSRYAVRLLFAREYLLRPREHLVCREEDIVVRGVYDDRRGKARQLLSAVFLRRSHLHFVGRHHQVEKLAPQIVALGRHCPYDTVERFLRRLQIVSHERYSHFAHHGKHRSVGYARRVQKSGFFYPLRSVPREREQHRQRESHAQKPS